MSEKLPPPAEYNATDEFTVARAGGEEYIWSWYWEPVLSRLARANPGYAVKLKSLNTRITLGGVIPAGWNGIAVLTVVI